MKKRVSMNLEADVIKAVDNARGLIDRSKFVNATLEQKVEQIREDGGVIGQV